MARSSETFSPHPLLVLGHRGAILGNPPMNSGAAFLEAVEAADGFETDACADAEGEVFLIHEAKYVDPAKGVEYCAAEHLDAPSAALLADRRIDQMTTSDMLRLRLSDGSPLPLLRETLEMVGKRTDKLLNIELKGFDVVEPVLAIVKDCLQKGLITPSSLLISSFNFPALERVRLLAPQLRIGAIFIAADQPSKPLFPWYPSSKGLYTSLTQEALRDPTLKRLRPDYFVMPQEILTEDTVILIATHYPDAKCAAWVFTEKGNFVLPEFLRRLRNLCRTGKIGAVIVDNPREFSRALQGELFSREQHG
ncbi:MAG: hypothetical protein M3N08_03015 [Pseudomonadota bacterium]|nr:hypothetical protein [Pseudomonadota bacterium]